MPLRRLELESGVWQYRIARSYAVLVSPTGQREVVPLDKLTGRSWDTLERGRWKKTYDGMVTPEIVRHYIERNSVA